MIICSNDLLVYLFCVFASNVIIEKELTPRMLESLDDLEYSFDWFKKKVEMVTCC